MSLTERAYNQKKKIEIFLKKYFTTEGTYTSLIPDKFYIKTVYKQKTGKKLNLKTPVSLNEKMQWLKLYNRQSRYTIMADKYLSRNYVRERLRESGYREEEDYYFVPILGVWDNVELIDFDSLPNQFVLKCNHDNGVIICRDKELFDIEKAKIFLDYHLHRDYYKKHREWSYKNIKRKIICEELLENPDGSEIVDYKIYAYGGQVRYFMYSLGEATGNHRNHKFDVDCNSIDYLFKEKPTVDLSEINLPDNINKMIEIANVLSKNEPHIRVDMYNIAGKIYIGELTFYSNGGFINIFNKEFSDKLASYIDIANIKRGSK